MHANIAKKYLDSEMTVVRNEMEIGENRPTQVLLKQLSAHAYLWHVYGRSIIGNRSDVENVPIERLQAFYRYWYQPDNATLIVAGKFDAAKTLQRLNTLFGGIPRPARKIPASYTVEPAQDGEHEVVIRRPGTSRYVAVAYHTPGFTHPDSPALEVLREIMHDDPNGRIYKDLMKTKIAQSADMSVDDRRDPGLSALYAVVPPGQDGTETEKALIGEVREGLSYYVGGNIIVDPTDDNGIFYMQATSAPENMGRVEVAMKEELQRLITGGVTEQEVADAKQGLLVQLKDSRSTDRALAGILRMDLFMKRDLGQTIDLENRIRALTVADVNAAIRQYLKPETLSTFVAGDFARVAKKGTAAAAGDN